MASEIGLWKHRSKKLLPQIALHPYWNSNFRHHYQWYFESLFSVVETLKVMCSVKAHVQLSYRIWIPNRIFDNPFGKKL
jgi:hypothetical protein